MSLVRLLKSRCLWLLLGTFLIATLSLAAIYRFWWYPSTFRGRFDRIQIGMTAKEVNTLLGTPGDYTKGPARPLCYYELWMLENGIVKYERVDVGSADIRWEAIRGLSTVSEWRMGNSVVNIEYCENQKVICKAWYDRNTPSRQFLRRLWPF